MTVIPMRPDTPRTNNPFRYFHELGWPGLIPLMPADAQVSPRWEYVQKAIQKHGEEKALAPMRGKAPAALWQDGKWGGFKGWRTHETTEADLDKWHSWGANVGFRMPEDWIIFDIDIADETWADEAERVIVAELGPSPCRIGMVPKRMLFYRLTDPVKGAWVFARIGGTTQAVEMFTDGRQVALFGMHRKAGRPYQWPRRPVHRDDITLIRPDQYEAVQAALLRALPEATSRRESTAADRAAIPQETLRGDPALIRKAMSVLPNNRTIFPDRNDYIRIGAALKAALPDDEDEAFDLWTEWAEKDDGGTPEVWRKDWNGLGHSFALGAAFIYEQAERHSGGAFSRAEVHFQPVPESAPSPFDLQAANEREAEAADVYPLLTVDEIVSRPPPTFLVDRHVPDTSVGFLYSDPGAGKSFLAIDLGLSIAHGETQWHGDALHPPADAAVIYIASEGSFDLRNRIKAWHKARGKDAYPARFFVIERTINFMEPEDIDRLIRTVRLAGVKPAFVVVDTVSRAMPGADENLQKEMTLFVRACDHVRDTFQCAVLGVHHAGKSGDMRGSTVLRGAGDFVMRLERKRGASVGTLTMEKQKAAEDGWARQVIFSKIVLDDGQSSLVSDAAGDVAPGSGGMKPGGAAAVLRAMRSAWDEGAPWSKGHQGKERFAVRRMVADHGIDAVTAEGMLALWEASGIIAVALRSARDKRYGYQVLIGGNEIDAMEQGNNDGGTGDVFD